MVDLFPMVPQSPDLTPLNFFLWGHLKNKISATPPATIEELKRRIIMEIQNITQKMLRKVFQGILLEKIVKNLFWGQ